MNPQLTDTNSIDDLIRDGLRPGDTYTDLDGTPQVFDPRDFYVGGDIPSDLLQPVSGYDYIQW